MADKYFFKYRIDSIVTRENALVDYNTAREQCSWYWRNERADSFAIYDEKIYPIIAIDTTLAAKYEDELHEENIAEYLYHIEEGKYSAYIDAVSMKFGPSSYHLDKLIDYPERKYERETIKELFAQIESV